ncbi:MAG: metallophosphoesterase [Candidatus Sumerlaeota bacterium]|nr:metallophosphoesterase [Candidatus Sumerlaeota bacterium]
MWAIALLLVLLAAGVALIAYMIFEAHGRLEVTDTTLEFGNLPPAFDGFRIVLVSDFHSRRLGWYEESVIRRLSLIDADMLVIAGDLKCRNTTPNEPVLKVLDALVAAAKRYPFFPVYTRGNHDRRGFDEACDARRDIHSLRDRSIALQRDGQRIHVAGTRRTARVPRRMRPALRKALFGIAPGDFTIFVSHSPDFFRMAARRGVDLMLSGDTHGGQISAPFYGPVMPKGRLGIRFMRGHIKDFGSQIYISRGIGTTGPPFRLGCRPEIAVLTLRRAQACEP